MKILVEFVLDDSYEAYLVTKESVIRSILKDQLDNVKFEIIEDQIKCPDCDNPHVHIPSSGMFWCEECGYIKSNN